MIKLAFCDDDLSALNEVRVLLDQYRVERNREIAYTAFQSPLELLSEVERGTRFDVLLLDVLMPGQNGIDTAAELRRYDGAVKIIFLTSSAEFAVQSYTVDAYFYLLKPVWKDGFFRVMDDVLSTCERERTDSLVLKCKAGITCVEPRRIEFCEILHRTLYIHLASGKVLESSGSLDDLAKELESQGCFLRPHRSFLVNLDYVQSLSYRAITMSCLTEIPLPRGKYAEVKDAFLEHAFQRGRVLL